MTASRNVLLITGAPGVGKTTLVKKVVRLLAGRKTAGFYTEEIRTGRVRQGFALVTLKGERFVMAHVHHASPHRVGKYGVDVRAIDAAVETALPEEREADFFIVDEIGKMECLSALFVERISSLLAAGRPVVATVGRRGGGFISEVKGREGMELWKVTRGNRDETAGRVVAWIEKRLPRER